MLEIPQEPKDDEKPIETNTKQNIAKKNSSIKKRSKKKLDRK